MALKEWPVMNVAVDWDATFTADPDTMTRVIKTFQEAGHVVYIVTARNPKDALECEHVLNYYGIENVLVIPTTYRAKKRVAKEEHNLFFHIWIDDYPLRVNVDEADEYKLQELL